jgi:hypothetical protein
MLARVAFKRRVGSHITSVKARGDTQFMRSEYETRNSRKTRAV